MSNVRKSILVFIANPNGWRNPNTFGGGEGITIKVLLQIDEFDWYVITTNQLLNSIKQDKELFNCIKRNNVFVFPIPLLFFKTNILGDIIQGISYLFKSIRIAYSLKSKIDLVYSSTNNFIDIFPASIVKNIFNKKLIIKYHISLYSHRDFISIFKNYIKEKNGFFDSVIRALLARITLFMFSSATKIICVSEHLRSQLLKCGIKKSKLVTNHNGVDFIYLKQFIHKYKKKYDFCYIGRIEKNKGISDLINLVDNLIKRSSLSPNLIIIGDGTFLDKAKLLVKQKKLEKNITFTGYIGEERYKILQQSKIFVNPTYALEGFGLTILESLYFDIPVISYTNFVFNDIFRRSRNAILIAPNLEVLIKNVKVALLRKTNHGKDNFLKEYTLDKCRINEKKIINSLL
ncbi:MAG: glycosyltransferase family 4 protein [Minisyncoccia bacterium]